MAPPDVLPFESLASLRDEHSRLLRTAWGADEPTEEQPAGLADDVVQFLARARATGQRLDTPVDREAAQSVLDYWTATLFTLPGGMTAAKALSSVRPGATDASVNLLLADFDEQTVGEVAAAADEWLAALPAEDQALSRRLLLRLAPLPPEGRAVRALPVPQSELAALGPEERLTKLLSDLESRQVIRQVGGQISLRYEALTRVWGTLAAWIGKRVAFRNAAEYWRQHDRDPAALISRDLLREAQEYEPKSEVEREFVESSRNAEVTAAHELARSREAELEQTKRLLTVTHQAKRRLWLTLALTVGVAVLAVLVYHARARRAEAEAGRAEADREFERREQQRKIQEKDDAQNRRRDAAIQRRGAVSRATDMLAVIRTLGELGATSNEAEFGLAKLRWDELMERLQADPELDRLVGGLDPQFDRTTTANDSTRIYKEAIRLSRDVRNRLLALSESEKAIATLLKGVRATAFRKAMFVTDGIVTALKSNRSYADTEPYRKEFWILYWSELVMVEGPAVEAAMVQFGRALLAVESEVVRRAADQSPSVADGLKNLSEQSVKDLTRQMATSRKSPDAINRLVKPTTAGKEWDRLRSDLDDAREALRAAIDAELKGDIEMGKRLPMAL